MAVQKTRGRAGTGAGTLKANPETVKAGDQAAGVEMVEAPRWPTKVKISDLADNPDNPREKLRRLGELARTIEEVGVLQRLVVIPREIWLRAKPHHDKPETQGGIGDKPYVILIGHRRRHASEMAGLEEVPVDVKEDVAEQSRRNALIENLQRDDLTVMEEARELDKMMREDEMSQRQAATTLGKSQGWVSQRISLLSLIPALQVAVDDGELKIEDAREVAKLLPELQQLLVDGGLELAVAREIAKLPEAEQLAADRTAPAPAPEPAPSPAPVPEPRAEANPAAPRPNGKNPQPPHDDDGLDEALRLEAAANTIANLRVARRVVQHQPDKALAIYRTLQDVLEEMRTDLEGAGLLERREAPAE
ncbi:ParB/RepB/Spo0J family partition protein [Nonomuraea sp. NPDC050394]|uniref:ParB/RepB/Spo0J family partition protein n=1 Tax=Nonomuraea sp. NPDC050394 TaxID=3364363 RepID=UPI0037AB263A